jgi:DNA-binding CsgD family transcriptional regulator
MRRNPHALALGGTRLRHGHANGLFPVREDAAVRTAGASPFVGREGELMALRETLAAAGREPSLTVVTGEAGVGKSRLVSEAIAPLRARGAWIVRGECIAAGRDVIPLAPVLEGLRHLVSELPGDAGGSLHAIADGIGSSRGQRSDGIGAYAAMVLRALLGSAGSRRVMLVIDDLQWADAISLGLVEHVARNVPAARITTLVTMRTGATGSRRISRVVGELLRRPHVSLLDLHPLERPDVEKLVRAAWADDAKPEVVARVLERSGGIPFYVEAILARNDREARSLPEDLRLVVTATLDALPPDARRVLDVLSEMTEPTSSSILSAAAGLSPERGLRAIKALADADVVVLRDDDWTVRHSLIREVARHGRSAGRTRLIHAALAGPLRAAATSRREPARTSEYLALAALHASLAADLGSACRDHLASSRTAMEAGRADLAANQAMAALRLLRRDAGLLAGTDWDVHDVEMLAVRALSVVGRPREALTILERRTGPTAGDDATLQAIMDRAHLRMILLGQLGEVEEAGVVAEALLHEVGARTDDPGLRCSALNWLISCWNITGRWEESLAFAREAVDLARITGSADDLVESQSNLAWSLLSNGLEQEAYEQLLEVARLARESGALRTGWGAGGSAGARVYALVNIGEGLNECGEHAAAFGVAEELSIAMGCREGRNRECRMLDVMAIRALHYLGRWADAVLRVRSALRDAEPNIAVFALVVHARVLAASGRFRQAADVVERTRRLTAPWHDSWNGPVLALAPAELAYWEGRRDGVRAAVASGLRAAAGQREPTADVLELHAMRLAAEGEAMARGRGDTSGSARARAGRWRQAAIEDTERALAALREVRLGGPRALLAARCRLEMAHLAGEQEPTGWRTTAEGWLRLGRPLDAAYALYRAALAEPSDPLRASDALGRAHALCASLPARPLAWRVERAAARLGLDLSGTGRVRSGPAATERLGGLTAREQQVAELLATGASDREIASELLITEKTASNHVSSILDKLGATRRGEVAALLRHRRD